MWSSTGVAKHLRRHGKARAWSARHAASLGAVCSDGAADVATPSADGAEAWAVWARAAFCWFMRTRICQRFLMSFSGRSGR